jgi:hypothetical protein
VGAKREPCVVRKVRSGAGQRLCSCAGRTGGANLGVGPPAAGHPTRCSISVASPRLTVTCGVVMVSHSVAAPSFLRGDGE